MGPFKQHVFVCTGGKTCPIDGTAEIIHARLREMVKLAGLKTSIRINHAGCLDQCGRGPMIAVYPENVWYCGVKAEDAEVIFKEHLVCGRRVERLVYHPLQPGSNKTAKAK